MPRQWNFLKQEYKRGPVLDSLTNETKLDEEKMLFHPYAMYYINAEMQRLNQEVKRDTNLRDDKWNEYVSGNSPFPKSYMLIPGI